MKKPFMCRYRDFFGRWQRLIIFAIDADAARELCSQRHGHCDQATAV